MASVPPHRIRTVDSPRRRVRARDTGAVTHSAPDRPDEVVPPPAPPVGTFAPPPAGWAAPSPAAPSEWSNQAPYGSGPYPPAAYPLGGYAPPAPTQPGKGIGTAALIVGFGSLLLCWIPVVGVFVALAAVILGIVALVQRQPKSVAITAMVLGGVTAVAGVVFTGTALTSLIDLYRFGDVESGYVDEPTSIYGDAAGNDPADFERLDDAAFAELAASPTAHYGEKVLVFGIVDGYNDDTGCSLNVMLGNAMATDGAQYDSWAYAYLEPDDGDWCSGTSWFLPGDHARFEATVRGTTTLEFVDGSVEDVMTLEIHRINEIPRLP